MPIIPKGDNLGNNLIKAGRTNLQGDNGAVGRAMAGLGRDVMGLGLAIDRENENTNRVAISNAALERKKQVDATKNDLEQKLKMGELQPDEAIDTYKKSISELPTIQVNHPSEWCYRESKWSILDKLLQHNPELLRHEKERIMTLSFWNEVPELANTPKVCHLHPVAFYQYALRRCGNPTCICHEVPKLNNDYFVLHPKIKNAKINTCNNSGLFKTGVKLIVLHRTSGGAAQGTLNHMATQGYGAHFVIDNQHGEDGIINQTISLNKRGSHMGVAQFKETKANGWGNHNAIGIEVCGYSLDAQGNKVVKNTDPPHDHWEPVTEKQAQSIACLVKFLLNYFNLSLNDVKCHEDLCVKTENEGKEVYKAMMKYW